MMKHYFSKSVMAAALVLALLVGAAALAEPAETSPELPAENAADFWEMPEAEEPDTEETPDAEEQPAQADTALQDALNAYNSARQSSRTENLEAELEGYVASGKLTREQADLILNYYKERQALRSGVCPNCGYELRGQEGFGKGGRMNGRMGGRGGRGGRGFKGGMNAQPSQGGMNAQPFQGGMNAQPSQGGTEGTAFAQGEALPEDTGAGFSL